MLIELTQTDKVNDSDKQNDAGDTAWMKAETRDNLPCMKSKHIGVTAGIEPTQIHVHTYIYF